MEAAFQLGNRSGQSKAESRHELGASEIPMGEGMTLY
jgi:hypothetical protein